jgi:hypothetical protein
VSELNVRKVAPPGEVTFVSTLKTISVYEPLILERVTDEVSLPSVFVAIGS